MPSPPRPVHRTRRHQHGTLIVEHRSDAAATGVAVLILPGLGYDDTCAYRPLRRLADELARRGHVVVRPDWPMLGDGGRDDRDEGALEACCDLVRLLTRELRDRGATRVSAVGVRAGGLIGQQAACLDALIRWSPPRSGKAFLREQKAFHRLAAKSLGQAPAGTELPSGAREAGGFYYAPDLVRDLTALDPTSPDQRLDIEDGVTDLLENPYQSKVLPAVMTQIVDGITAGEAAKIRPPPGAGPLLGDGFRERVWEAPGSSGQLVGVICEPLDAPATDWTLFFNAGGIRRSGPGRLWTRAARELARRGRASLRFDVRDVGDSDGADEPRQDLEEMYAEASVQDALTAYDALVDQGAHTIDAVGLCSGAFLGAQVASRRPIRRALLFNGLAFVWNDDARASGMTDHIAGSLLDRRRWKRLLTGRIDARRLARSVLDKARLNAAAMGARLRGDAPPDPIDQLFLTIRRAGTDLHLVSSDGDPSIAYLTRHIPADRLPRWSILPAVDHTIRPVWAHEEVVRLVCEDAGLWSRPRS